jgi:pyruvate/2-oxoglutarate dehydrogenase complex dihydrolipoamide dehydrogenase (E3) component
VPGIWALGDVKGGPAFTHISNNDFQIVSGNLVEGRTLSVDNRIVPTACSLIPNWAASA